jgi:hypothetical protein
MLATLTTPSVWQGQPATSVPLDLGLVGLTRGATPLGTGALGSSVSSVPLGLIDPLLRLGFTISGFTTSTV